MTLYFFHFPSFYTTLILSQTEPNPIFCKPTTGESVLNSTAIHDYSIKNLKLHDVVECNTLVKTVALTLRSLEINLQTLLVHEASVYFCWNRA